MSVRFVLIPRPDKNSQKSAVDRRVVADLDGAVAGDAGGAALRWAGGGFDAVRAAEAERSVAADPGDFGGSGAAFWVQDALEDKQDILNIL